MKNRIFISAGIIVFTILVVFLASLRSNEELGLVDVTPTPIPQTPEPTPEPSTSEPPETIFHEGEEEEESYEPRNIVFYEGDFELPIIGATGWAASFIDLHENRPASPGALGFKTLDPGQIFIIENTYNEWWNIRLPDEISGWVLSYGCFINMPDIIPSIIYRITNASESVLRSSGYDIPNITGQKLYEARHYNPRLGRYEYFVPIQYLAARGVMRVQQAALAQNETLIVYEAFRPRETQRAIVDNLRILMNENEYVRTAITTPPWSIGWFISTGISNHQRGAAVDVSLATISEYEIRFADDYAYRYISQYVQISMPTPMHELSPTAATLTRPSGPIADTMTQGALRMQEYFLNEGFTMLASEWWHFNYPRAIVNGDEFGMIGEFSP